MPLLKAEREKQGSVFSFSVSRTGYVLDGAFSMQGRTRMFLIPKADHLATPPYVMKQLPRFRPYKQTSLDVLLDDMTRCSVPGAQPGHLGKKLPADQPDPIDQDCLYPHPSRSHQQTSDLGATRKQNVQDIPRSGTHQPIINFPPHLQSSSISRGCLPSARQPEPVPLVVRTSHPPMPRGLTKYCVSDQRLFGTRVLYCCPINRTHRDRKTPWPGDLPEWLM
jgi:hypothetical protein